MGYNAEIKALNEKKRVSRDRGMLPERISKVPTAKGSTVSNLLSFQHWPGSTSLNPHLVQQPCSVHGSRRPALNLKGSGWDEQRDSIRFEAGRCLWGFQRCNPISLFVCLVRAQGNRLAKKYAIRAGWSSTTDDRIAPMGPSIYGDRGAPSAMCLKKCLRVG